MTVGKVGSLRSRLVIFSVLMFSLAGCTGRVATDSSKLAEVEKGKAFDRTTGTAAVNAGTRLDMEAQEIIAKGCVEAWRTELAGDEDLAMEKLNKLAKTYPEAVTIQFMMGQVKEHAGKTEEAVEFYRQAVGGSHLSSMALFKLAEALRTTGETDKAIKRYRELLAQSPGFVPAQVGLAQALIVVEPDSQEARELIGAVLRNEPDNIKAKETAKKIGLR